MVYPDMNYCWYIFVFWQIWISNSYLSKIWIWWYLTIWDIWIHTRGAWNKDDTLQYQICAGKFLKGLLSLDDNIPFESQSLLWLASLCNVWLLSKKKWRIRWSCGDFKETQYSTAKLVKVFKVHILGESSTRIGRSTDASDGCVLWL